MRLVRADPLRHQPAAGKSCRILRWLANFVALCQNDVICEFHSPKTMELVVVISAGSAENSQNGVSRSLIRINVRISYRLHFTSSTCHFINAPLHQRVASSTYRVIDVPRHPAARHRPLNVLFDNSRGWPK